MLQTALIYSRKKCSQIPEKIHSITKLLESISISWLVDKETSHNHELKLPNDRLYSAGSTQKPADFIICIGGDGSILHAAQDAIVHNIPILGINHGRVGFLTESIKLDEENFCTLLQGNYTIEPRLTLEMWINNNGTRKHLGYCLNETCITRHLLQHVLEISLTIDNNEICQLHGDGVIISTPTGSTAYALSAGGPIISPNIQAISIIPICPHKLSSRPIVVSASSTIELSITHCHDECANLVFDAQPPREIKKNEQLIIKASQKPIHFIHPKNHSFYDKLKHKLFWERRDHAKHD